MPTVGAGALLFLSVLMTWQRRSRPSRGRQILADLIAGRLDLLDAVSQFGALQSGQRMTSRPTVDDGEQVCRAVIGWAHWQLRGRPEVADAVAGRLQNELQALLARQERVPPAGE
jgi:hypothetical protein